MKKGSWLMIVGCLMMLGAFLFSGLDIYRLFTFEKVDAAVEVYRSTKGKKPENPHMTNFAMETLFLLGGVLILYGELKQKDD